MKSLESVSKVLFFEKKEAGDPLVQFLCSVSLSGLEAWRG